MRKEQHQTHLLAESILRGELLPYKHKHLIDCENRILTVNNQYFKKFLQLLTLYLLINTVYLNNKTYSYQIVPYFLNLVYSLFINHTKIYSLLYNSRNCPFGILEFGILGLRIFEFGILGFRILGFRIQEIRLQEMGFGK